MVKPSEVDLPVTFKKQLLFKAGKWNNWDIKPEEVNRSILNTSWNKFNSALIFTHKDKNPNEFAESIAGNVTNIYSDGMGAIYGDINIWDQNTAIKAKYGNAPYGVSAGIAWPEEYDNPTNFVYRNFSLITDPGVRDKEIYLNFSADGSAHDGMKFANFSAIMTSEVAKGSDVESSSNEKSEHSEKDCDCKKDDCEICKKKASMENCKDNNQMVNTDQMKEDVIKTKEEQMACSEKEADYINIDERRLQNTDKKMIEKENNSDSYGKRMDAMEERVAKFEAILSEKPVEPTVQQVTPPVEAPAPIVAPPQPVAQAPVISEDVVERVANKLADKIIPTLKPIPMTTNEFAGSQKAPEEDTVERLVRDLSVKK